MKSSDFSNHTPKQYMSCYQLHICDILSANIDTYCYWRLTLVSYKLNLLQERNKSV